MAVTDEFRKNLKALRQAKGLDAANLSLAAGLNRRAVTDIEIGASKNPTLNTAVSLADVLGVSVLDLIGRSPRHRLVSEWENFLGQYPEDVQRKFLASVKALRLEDSEAS